MKTFHPKLEVFLHLMTAFVLLLKGFDKITHHHLISGTTLLVLTVAVLALVFLGERLYLSHSKVKQACLLIESLALSVVALVFFQEGRVYLPYAFGTCALAYLVVAFVHYKKHKGSVH